MEGLRPKYISEIIKQKVKHKGLNQPENKMGR